MSNWLFTVFFVGGVSPLQISVHTNQYQATNRYMFPKNLCLCKVKWNTQIWTELNTIQDQVNINNVYLQ